MELYGAMRGANLDAIAFNVPTTLEKCYTSENCGHFENWYFEIFTIIDEWKLSTSRSIFFLSFHDRRLIFSMFPQHSRHLYAHRPVKTVNILKMNFLAFPRLSTSQHFENLVFDIFTTIDKWPEKIFNILKIELIDNFHDHRLVKCVGISKIDFLHISTTID